MSVQGPCDDITNNPGKIFQLIPKVMEMVGPITKGGTAPSMMGGYKFRKIDDVLEQVQPAFIKYGIFITPAVLDVKREERTDRKGKLQIVTVLRMKYTFWASDGSHVDVISIGEGIDSSDKGSNKAMSAALKYAITHMLASPCGESVDTEDYHEEVSAWNSAPDTGVVPAGLSESQIKRLYAISSVNHWHNEDVKKELKNRYKVGSSRELTKAQYDEFCDVILPGKK